MSVITCLATSNRPKDSCKRCRKWFKRGEKVISKSRSGRTTHYHIEYRESIFIDV
ncbi:MAG: hypothetical protein OEX10_09025 [Candidatus Bathyarchaeota archaeon]|nr:hypothetical protein [Candidatus Bathyarchaeota archaeon]